MLASLRLSLLLFPLGVSLLQCEASLPAPFAVGVRHVVVFSPYPAYRRGSSAFAFVLSDAVAGCARDFARALACGAPDSRAVSARRAVLRLLEVSTWDSAGVPCSACRRLRRRRRIT